ncbi:Uncharacterized protein QTN25_003003 [Entamoeba marina]
MNPNQSHLATNPITSAPPPIDRSSQQANYQQFGYHPPQYNEQPQQFMYQYGHPQPYNGQSGQPGQPGEQIQQQVQRQAPQPQQHPYDYPAMQQMIEGYLQLYYTDEEIITEMKKSGISAESTMFLLQKLKEQNPNYFKAYEIRLIIKSQINKFNQLIQRHMMANSTNQNDPMVSQEMYNEYGSFSSAPYRNDQSMGGM